jgi:hypothetical protein
MIIFIILAINCYINVYKLMQLFICCSFGSHEMAVISTPQFFRGRNVSQSYMA